MQNTGHGHVFPRPDGIVARCGGPSMCRECAKELARKNIIDAGYKGATPTAAPDIEAMIHAYRDALLLGASGKHNEHAHDAAERALRTALAAGAKADHALIEKYRNAAGQSGHFKFPDDVAAIVRAYDEQVARVRELEADIAAKDAALKEIGDKAHDARTGPAVPDTLWEIRELAYAAFR